MDAPHWALSSDGSGWMIYHPQPWMTQRVETKPLDATAKEWSPQTDGAPEEDRCLFMTFSNGHPVTEQEISRFFTLHYGDCVERVYVHWPQPKDSEENNITTPQFGKVVFKTSWIPLVMTLCGKRQIKFMLDGKTLWCKMFDPQKAQAFKRNGAS